MQERLVVCFRDLASSGHAQGYSEIRDLLERATQGSFRVVAWLDRKLVVDLALEKRASAIQLANDLSRTKPYAIGIASGLLNEHGSLAKNAMLCSGQALSDAVLLSQIAGAGEVLLAPAVLNSSKGAILTLARRRYRVRGEAKLGLLLDSEHPFLPQPDQALDLLVTAPMLGRALPSGRGPGELCLVRGGPGSGKSRFLRELQAKHHLKSTLYLAPHAPGEPFGALRWAFECAGASGRVSELPPVYAKRLRNFLNGSLLEQEAAVELVRAWLRVNGRGLGCLLLLDDVDEVDVDSLRTVCEAARNAGAQVAMSLGFGRPVPDLLSGWGEQEIVLSPLSLETRAQLIQKLTNGKIGAALAGRIARGLDGTPLGICAKLEVLLTRADLVPMDDRLVTRRPSKLQPRLRGTAAWLRIALKQLDSSMVQALCMLAVLGGSAPRRDLYSALRHADVPGNHELILEALVRRRWVQPLSDEAVGLHGRTQRELLLSDLTEADARAFHQAAAASLIETGRPSAASAAALHAALAGNTGKASLLARRAAALANEAGLLESAACLNEFAKTPEPALLSTRGLSGPFAVAQRFDDSEDATEKIVRILVDLPESTGRLDRGEQGKHAPPRAQPSPRIPAGTDATARSHSVTEGPKPRTGKKTFVAGAVLRLLAGTLTESDRGAGLRDLRRAKEAAKRATPTAKSRAALALAVALTATGRHQEALLEALEALARAREANDAQGVRASARLLCLLSQGAGQPKVAERWQSLYDDAQNGSLTGFEASS